MGMLWAAITFLPYFVWCALLFICPILFLTMQFLAGSSDGHAIPHMTERLIKSRMVCACSLSLEFFPLLVVVGTYLTMNEADFKKARAGIKETQTDIKKTQTDTQTV